MNAGFDAEAVRRKKTNPMKQTIPVTQAQPATAPLKDIQHYMRPGTLQLAALPPLSLYVHLPWCLKKCPYCDFNSHEFRAGGGAGALPEQRYIDALMADLEASLPLIWGRTVHSIFIGGGTPSLFSPQAIDRLLSDIRARLWLEPECEITLEANPSSVEAAKFAALASAGVNRVSLGVQALDDAALRFLGRLHGVDEALAALDVAQRIAAYTGTPVIAATMTDQLNRRLNPYGNYFVTDWTQQHANFFRAVQMEKRVMFIILTLIVAVAAFNIVSTLVMAVTDKRADIAIMRTFGASPASIMKIFIIQGAFIGVIGTVLGAIFGILIALNIETIIPFIEHLFNVQFLAKDVYYISDLPSDLVWSDVITIVAVSFILSLLATIYPSYKASRINPAEALRYE